MIFSFTTIPYHTKICKDTKIESNSQPWCRCRRRSRYCFRRAKIQNLSAIHNQGADVLDVGLIVSDVQRYKICQQFTTQPKRLRLKHDCFRRTKIQNLSAIHNLPAIGIYLQFIVSDVQRYKICQQFTTRLISVARNDLLFQTYKDTKFVSNSQHIKNIPNKEEIVSDVQRYKICQQFTTLFKLHLSAIRLFQTYKDTKFVSNSQLRAVAVFINIIVSDVQRYKICQQFTTYLR